MEQLAQQFALIMQACRDGDIASLSSTDTDLLRMLCNSMDESSFTPLIIACRHGHEHVAKLLFEHNARVEDVTRLKNNALMYACASGNVRLVELLLEHCPGKVLVSRNAARDSCLMWGAKSGNEQVVQCLSRKMSEEGVLDKEVNASNKDGITALMCAVQTGNIAMIKCLVENGANVKAKDRFGRSVREYIVKEGADKSLTEEIETLIDGRTERLSHQEILELFEVDVLKEESRKPKKGKKAKKKPNEVIVSQTDGEQEASLNQVAGEQVTQIAVEQDANLTHIVGEETSEAMQSELKFETSVEREMSLKNECLEEEQPSSKSLCGCKYLLQELFPASEALDLEVSNILGASLDSLSFSQLQEVERILHESLLKVRQEKDERQQRLNAKFEYSIQELSEVLDWLVTQRHQS